MRANLKLTKGNKSGILELLICISILCLLFIPTLNRPWLLYDERILFDNLCFPTPLTFGEIFEIIEKFGANFNIISSNAVYSQNYVQRTCPLSLVLDLLTSFFFNKEAFAYHLFNFVLHLINTSLVFFILKIFIFDSTFQKRCILITLTLLWAVHPIMIESVLLTTNFGATFSYIFFFGLLLDFLVNKEKNKSFFRKLVIPILFLVPMLTNEYIVTLPFVLFVFSFYQTYKSNQFKKAISTTFEETLPYFSGLILYIIFFIFFSDYKTIQVAQENHFIAFLERIFWLSPQIFFHFFKLVFYPKTLSIDQGLFVQLGKTLFDPYSIFCIGFFFAWLFIPLILFLYKRLIPNLFLLTGTFFFAILPFLHILMPSYTLAAERYLYCPLALLIFSLAKILSGKTNQWFTASFSIALFLALALCLNRSYYRILDWKNNYSFIESTYKASKDPLHKAAKLQMLANAMALNNPNKKEETKNYFLKTLQLLNQAKKENKILQLKYQKHLPLIMKSYGIDYDSVPVKIAYLEAYTRCSNLYEPFSIGIKILRPYMKNPAKVDPMTLDLYTHLLLLDKKYKEAKKILLIANSKQPHLPVILLTLFEIAVKFENDWISAEKYLLEAFKYYPYETSTLEKALVFYDIQKNLFLKTKFAYLLGLRMQLKPAYQEAMNGFLDLGQLKEAKQTMNKLLKLAPHDPETIYLVNKYFYKLGKQTLNY